MGIFVPRRRRGHEILDDAGVDAATRLASIADVTRSNVLFGGRRAAVDAVVAAMSPNAAASPSATMSSSATASSNATMTLLDVGTGLADIPAAIARRAQSRGIRVTTIGVDEAVDLLRTAAPRLSFAVAADASALPFRDRSVDIVTCSQLLHHFADADLAGVIRELDRVARARVVIADLRRSWLAAAGFWLVSFPLRFHPVTRHDGVVSVLRGFVAAELRDLVHRATGVTPAVHHRLGFRLTASWTPSAARHATSSLEVTPAA